MGGGDLRSQLHPDSIWGILNKMGEMQLEGTETGAANGEDWQEEIYQKDEQQESQNSEQYLYNQQLRQHLMKLKFQPGGVPQSIMQSQIQQQLQKQQQQQQQNLLQPNQLQSSQQAVMQNSLWQTPASSTLQIQQSSLQQSTQSLLQQQPQSVHMLQQSEVPVQQQMQPNMANMLPNQGEQSQSQPMQQQLMSQIQSQPGQLQQQMGLQQQANALQRDMPLRIQTSGPLLQQQTTIDQQKQLLQSQRGIPEAPMNSSTQMGNANGGDWQEDIYQKIKSMRMYLPELNEKYQRLAAKVQQHHQHDAIPQQAKNDQLEKLRSFKDTLESLTLFLQHNKRVFRALQPAHKEKILRLEKMVVNMLGSHRPRKPISSLQEGQLAQPHVHPMQQSQQQQSQISQMHTNEGQMNSQMQQMSVQSSVPTTQQNNLTTLQPYSLSSVSSVSNSRQNMMDGMQPGANVDSGQGNAMNQMQQVAMNSLQQNPLSGPQLMNVISMLSQSGLTALQSNVNSFPTNPDILQPQQIKQEQEMFSTQQIKQQYQQQQMQQQYMLRQLLIRQQQQITQQQSTQLLTQQIMQLSQMNDTNDMKMWHHMGGKAGVLQQHNANKQGPYHPQQMKPGTSFSISLQQVLQASSPQIGHHPSPQIDQQNLLSSHTKAGTPLQPANSPFVVQSPSTSMAPSPMPGESEKIASGVTSLANPGNSVHQPTTAASMPNQSLAIGTPGISASPLLAEFSSPDGTHGVASTIAAGNSNVVEQPLERLLKAVKSMSPKALSASVSDISSVVSMVDRIAGSAPGNGSRAAVGEDLVAMTKCRLQARNFFTQDGPSGNKKMRRYTSAMPSNVVSSTGSANDNFRHLNGNESDGESTGASSIKRPRIEANHALEEELREINQRLIDTVVYISEDDVDPTAAAAAAAAEGGEGTIVKCFFSAVALSPNLKSQYASAQMSPIQPLRLLVPNNYPNCSPILLDKFPVEVSKEYEDLSIKAKSRFSISLRTLTQPMSLGDIARTWDKCARSVISEYAEQSGGGTFSSKYGTWENCLSAA